MKIDKIKDVIKNNYKLIIPLTLILVLFIAFLIYYKVAVLDGAVKQSQGDFYQYFYDKKYEYKAIVSTNRKDVIVNFETDDYDIKFDSTPIYYKKEDKVIFPTDVSVVMPTLNCAEYRAVKYSYLSIENDNFVLTTKNYSNKLGRYFIYDGNDMYFFLDDVTLSIGDEKIQLSPMSYVIARYNKYMSYYDKKSDTFRTIEGDNDQVVVENDYYKIYVSLDDVDYYGTDVILTSKIDELNTIDMKGDK